MYSRSHNHRRHSLWLTRLESRITPALSIYGPHTTLDMTQIVASGGDAWQVHALLPSAPAGAKTYLDIKQSIPARLDITSIRDHLSVAPLLFAPSGQSIPLELSLPKPDGTFARFRVWEYSIMEPGYVEQNQTFWAYRGQGIDDPSATLGADVSLNGFHAQVLSPNGAWYIDPYWHMETTEYVSYYAKDLNHTHGSGCTCGLCEAAATTGLPQFTAGRTPSKPPSESLSGFSPLSPPSGSGGGEPPSFGANGGITRTYRLAIASTAEFTALVGGTVAKTDAAIKTAVNRVNQIYLNELSVLFTLVTNNNSLIFTDTNTDGYTTGVRETLAEENHAKVDAVIGNANYDVSQVFDAGSNSGYAPGRVGQSTTKGKGSSATTAAPGEGFYRLFAHEMGHMFTASHTFNSSAAGGNGQYSAATAYEPGAGSTLMSYGGGANMGADDFNGQVDPYFHIANLDQMTNYIINTIPTVGTKTANGNNAPFFGTGPNQVIPARTPFFLQPSGVGDSNGDSLTFTWEQKDLDLYAEPLSAPDNGFNPLFRSFPPSATSVRYFPRLDLSAANQPTPAEQLPTTNRTMHFDLTIRDNNPGGGAYNSAGMTVQSVDTGAAFRVTSQKFGASWLAGTQQTVNWDVAGTTGNGINTANVRLSLSTDGGLTYPIDLGQTANDGSEVITVPNVTTTTARVKVQATNQNFFAINGDVTAKNQNITIAASNLKGAGLTITGLPTLRPNREVQIDFNVANEGAAVGEFEVRFFTSNNATIDFDPLIGTYTVPSLAANSTLNGSTVLQLPSHNSTMWNGDGTYYIGMFLDWSNKVNETNESDNINVGLGTDLVAITVTQVADDAYEQNDSRETASTVLQNKQGVWLSSTSGKGIQHDRDYYAFTVPAQTTKYAHVMVDLSFDSSTGNMNGILEAPPYYIYSAGTSGPGVIDFYGNPGDYYVYVDTAQGYQYPTGNPYDLRWTAGPDLRGPQVTAVSASDGGDAIQQNERLVSAVPGLKIDFNEPLTKATAESLANWKLLGNGADISGQISKITYSEVVVDIVTKRYIVTLDLATPQTSGTFELQALAGITDADGVFLDGNADNKSGDPFIRDFSIFAPVAPGPEQGVAQIKGGHQRRPAIALKGSYVAVWESYGQDGDSPTESNIHAQLFNDNGTIVGPEFRVNQYTTGEQSHPTVASDGKGNFIVAWQSLAQDGNGYGVYYREFKSDGTSGNETAVNQFGTAGNQQHPAVAMNAEGKFVLAYETNRQAANGYDVVIFGSASIPGGSGDFFHNPFNQYTTGDQTQPAVAFNAAGNYIVTWQSAGQDGSGLGIMLRTSIPYGGGGEGPVNLTTAGNQSDPAVAVDAAGSLVITWTSQGQDGNGDGVYARRYQNFNNWYTFAPSGLEFQVNQVAAGDQNSAAPALDADGDTVITWQSALQDGAGFGVFARRYSVTGVPQGNEFLINSYTTVDQSAPSVAVDADGDYFVVWQSTGQDGDGDGIFGRTYSVEQPEVTGTFAGVSDVGSSPYTLAVTITDNLGVNVGTLGTGDIRISGQNGFNTLASFVGVDVSTNGTPRVATYKFNPPGGSWGTSDNGIYSILVEPFQISDTGGNFATAGTVGAIVVNINADFLVTNTADSGMGSLRQAILNANAAAGANMIAFDPEIFTFAKTIMLTTGEMAITETVTIQGPGATLATVHGNNTGRIFNTQAATAGSSIVLEGLTLTGGTVTGSGGAIIGGDENITIRKCVLFANNATDQGGAISGGALIIEDSTLSNNKSGPKGGALISSSVTIRRSTLSGNSSTSAGGAIYGTNSLSIEDCTLSGNTSAGGFFGSGGGVYFFGAASKFLISNSTLSANAGKSSGGAMALVNVTGAASIQNSTITGNLGGVYCGLGTGLTLINSTIIAGNSGGDLRYNSSQSVAGNNNLIGNADGGNFTLTGTGNQMGTSAAPLDAKLGPLANNGGPTLTHALLTGSLAIDSGSNPAGLAYDQRGVGFVRVGGKSADIGAFEVQPLPPPHVVSVTVNDGSSQRSRVTDVRVTFNQIVNLPATPADAFELRRQNDNGLVGLTTAVNNSGPGTVVTFTFAGALSEFGSLADGRYTLTIDASKVSNANGKLDGDSDGVPGGNYSLVGSPANGLFRLFGDGDGNGTVNQTDFIAFRNAFNNGSSSIFDFEGDANVTQSDFIQFETGSI